MFASIFAFFMAIWNYEALNTEIISSLYRVKPQQGGQEVKLSNRNHLLPCARLCYKDQLKRKVKALEKANDALEKELSIIELLKAIRFFHNSIKLLLSKSQFKEVWDQSRYVVLDPDTESSETITPAL